MEKQISIYTNANTASVPVAILRDFFTALYQTQFAAYSISKKSLTYYSVFGDMIQSEVSDNSVETSAEA